MMKAIHTPLFCLLLMMLTAGAHAADRTVSEGFQAGLAVINQDVTNIAITQSVNLEPFGRVLTALTSTGNRPFTISRSITIYNAGSGSVTLDMAYLSGFAQIASGVTVTFRGLTLQRLAGNLPTAVFKDSPGAFVVLDNCELHVEVCIPTLFSQQFFTTFIKRPDGGTNQATFTPGSTTIQLVNVQSVAPVTAPNLGGYTITYTNTQFTCSSELPLSSIAASCPELTTTPPGTLTRPCVQASVQIVFQALCPSQTCINYCRSQCSRRRRALRA